MNLELTRSGYSSTFFFLREDPEVMALATYIGNWPALPAGEKETGTICPKEDWEMCGK